MDSDKNITARLNDTTNDDEIVEEESSQPVELSISGTLPHVAIENLPANSNKIIITVSSPVDPGGTGQLTLRVPISPKRA